MTHPDTLQRAAFEAWAASKHIDTTRDGFGGYESRWTEGASEGWRAAQAALEPVAWSNASWLSNPHAGHFSAKKTDSFNVPLYTSPPDPGGLLRDALSNLNDLADQKNAEIDALKEAMRLALEALQLVPALIQYQFTGDRDAMNALQNASNACEAAIAALEGMVNRV